ncbi:hypothetical protein M1P56_35655 (plasmid) [Streptomyces sp. HU2014]|uniref:hypothetical protein n=1 Tax=Streptomyces sp. HU2014 TaxID=2939414 RepID=UPI00200E0FF4|nr:hypothetical protein [Streptomyces sp. HU2014]UQI49828.1 hypothetical protein M1P56_35655 [Streptomyces sp. HU2014]
MTHRSPIGAARATASDGTVTTYVVHAADDRHLHVTRGDADAGPWHILHAPPGPVRREEFSQIILHTDRPTPATERPTPSCR